MIAFGCATTDERRFRRAAAVAIEAVADRDSLLMRRLAADGFATPYDEMLAEARRHDDLEAVVLLDESVSRLAADLTARVRDLLAHGGEPYLVGASPLRGVREGIPESGALLVLSARAVHELRCDPAVAGALDTLAVDLCLQARERGETVVASGDFVLERAGPSVWGADLRRDWLEARVALSAKWSGRAVLER